MPSLTEYIRSNESILTRTAASKQESAAEENRRGQIACTTNRVIFSGDGYVTDISLRSVNSIEYETPSVNWNYIVLGLIGVMIALAAWIIGQTPDSPGSTGLVTIVEGVSGIGLLIVGVSAMKHRVRIHTPSKSYSFLSRNSDLRDVAHAVRDEEP